MANKIEISVPTDKAGDSVVVTEPVVDTTTQDDA